MRPAIRIASPLAVFAVALAAAAATAAAAPADRSAAHTVFALTDDPTGNHVVAYDADASGALRQAGVYATGGLGGILAGSVVDHTASQGALAYDASHRLLLASNPGSSTVSVFRVDGDRLALTQILPSGGSFPVSIAARGGTVYVLNALGGGSIQGYAAAGEHLFPIQGSHRDLGLGTDASSPFTATPGQVAFSPDGSKLIVTTKATGNDIDVFGVGPDGDVSASPVVNADPGAVPFAVSFDRSGDLLVAEAGSNSVASFSLAGDGTATLLNRIATGQAATCWLTATGPFLYASNAASASLSGYAAGAGGSLAPVGTTPTDPGTVDSAATPDGGFLYVQAGKVGNVDAFRIGADGSLAAAGSVTVPGAAGAEGIVAL